MRPENHLAQFHSIIRTIDTTMFRAQSQSREQRRVTSAIIAALRNVIDTRRDTVESKRFGVSFVLICALGLILQYGFGLNSVLSGVMMTIIVFTWIFESATEYPLLRGSGCGGEEMRS